MPKSDFDQLRNRLHGLMGDFLKQGKPLPSYQAERCFHPPMDIFETEENLVILLEVAGMSTKDFNVFFDRGVLSISGTRGEVPSESKTRLHQMEIDYGCFERSVRIPFPLKKDEIKASYHQGLLIITAPKSKEETIVEVIIR